MSVGTLVEMLGVAFGIGIVCGFGIGILWESGFIARGLRDIPARLRAWRAYGRRTCIAQPNGWSGRYCGQRLSRDNAGVWCRQCVLQHEYNKSLVRPPPPPPQNVSAVVPPDFVPEKRQQQQPKSRTRFQQIQIDGPK